MYIKNNGQNNERVACSTPNSVEFGRVREAYLEGGVLPVNFGGHIHV
jgi:hypothetical protein